jgi:hypothetical protein
MMNERTCLNLRGFRDIDHDRLVRIKKRKEAKRAKKQPKPKVTTGYLPDMRRECLRQMKERY